MTELIVLKIVYVRKAQVCTFEPYFTILGMLPSLFVIKRNQNVSQPINRCKKNGWYDISQKSSMFINVFMFRYVDDDDDDDDDDNENNRF
jgi:hypothetical protein